MPGNPNEIKLVNNAMSNATRRKIMNFLSSGDKSTEEIGGEVGKTMLDFHLKLLQQASLIEIEEETVKLSEYGKNFLKDKEEKGTDKTADLSQVKPVEVTEVRQLLPCIADSSKFRVIANIAPPLGGALKVLEPTLSQRQILGQDKCSDNTKRRSYHNGLWCWKSYHDND